MLKITILNGQEPSAQSADRTKAVQVWSLGNMDIPKPRKWPSKYHQKINSGFHARKNAKQQYLKVVTFRDFQFSKKRIYVCNHAG